MRIGPRLLGLTLIYVASATTAQAEPPSAPRAEPLPGARVASLPAPVFAASGASNAPAPRRDVEVVVPAVRRVLVTPAVARDTVAAALRAAGSPRVSVELSSMAARARTSAALPELFLRAVRSTDDSLRLSPTIDNPYAYSALGGAGIWLEGRLVWHFDRLVFDREEVAVERLRREHADSMAKLRSRVLDALFAWQRAVFRAEDPKANADELEQASLSRAEQEAVLDVLTAGWFSDERRTLESRATPPAFGASPSPPPP